MARNTLWVSLIAVGVGVNVLDAYFSGNLPFSPAASDGNNKVSALNKVTDKYTHLTLGTVLALIGASFLVLGWIRKR